MGKGHQSLLLNLGLGSLLLSAQVPLSQRKGLTEGETQRAGEARILPAPRRPTTPPTASGPPEVQGAVPWHPAHQTL